MKASTSTKKTSEPKAKAAPPILKFDDRGLVSGIEYKFTPEGFVDWRAMIPAEFLYPNREWFESKNKAVPSSTDGLEDNQLLVKLGGIKYVAKLRGIGWVDYSIMDYSTPEHVGVQCTIEFLPNFETQNRSVHFSALANASLVNMSNFVAKFPESIAENRAFVRCVRNFLNINIVGDDEIDKNKEAVLGSQSSDEKKEELPNRILKQLVAQKLSVTSFDKFKENLRDLYKRKKYKPADLEAVASWSDFGDIPVAEVRNIVGVINKEYPA